MLGRLKNEPRDEPLRHERRRALRSAPRAFGIALELALIGALAAAAAYCTWVLLAPRAKAAPELTVESAGREAPSAAARQLFAPGAAPQVAGSARLIGVLSPHRAVLVADNGRPRSLAIGESVGELVLREVHPDHVVVSRAGNLERLGLERRSAPSQERRSAPGVERRDAPPAPPGARGDGGR